jgi:hypothetical protein
MPECGHWAWGAQLVDTPPKGWVCTHCGQDRNRRKTRPENMVGRHTYLFDQPRCTPCARAWHDRHCHG